MKPLYRWNVLVALAFAAAPASADEAADGSLKAWRTCVEVKAAKYAASPDTSFDAARGAALACKAPRNRYLESLLAQGASETAALAGIDQAERMLTDDATIQILEIRSR